MAMFTRKVSLALLTTSLFIALISACGANSATTGTTSQTTASTTAPATQPSTANESTRPVLISAENFDLPIIGDGKSTLPAKVTSADDIEVTITDTSRIIVLNEAIAEIVISLGFADKIIGRDATTTLAALTAIPKSAAVTTSAPKACSS